MSDELVSESGAAPRIGAPLAPARQRATANGRTPIYPDRERHARRRADEVAYSIGLIDTSLSVAATRANYRINDRARAWFAAGERGDFSAAIRR